MSNFREVSIIFILGCLVHRKSQCLKCNYEKTCDGLNFERRKFTDCDVMEITDYNRLKANQKNDLQANADAEKSEANEYILKKQAKLMELINQDPRIDWKTRDIKMENSKNYKIIIRLTPRLFDQEQKTIRQKPVNKVQNVKIVKERPNNDTNRAPSKTGRINPDPSKTYSSNHGSQIHQPDNRRPLRIGSPNQIPPKSGPRTRSPQNFGMTNRGPQNLGPQYAGSQNGAPQNFGPRYVGPQHAVRQNLGPPDLNHHNNGPSNISTTRYYQSNYAAQNNGSSNGQNGNPSYEVPINNSYDGAHIAYQAPLRGNINRNNTEPTIQFGPNAVVSQAVTNPSAPYIHYESDAQNDFINRVAGDPQSLPYVMDEIFYN